MKIVVEVSEKDYLNFLLQYDNGILDEKTPSHRAKIAIANGYKIDEQRIIKDICIGGSTDDWCDHNCAECEMLEITPKELFESIRRKRNEDSD